MVYESIKFGLSFSKWYWNTLKCDGFNFSDNYV